MSFADHLRQIGHRALRGRSARRAAETRSRPSIPRPVAGDSVKAPLKTVKHASGALRLPSDAAARGRRHVSADGSEARARSGRAPQIAAPALEFSGKSPISRMEHKVL